MFEMQTLLYVHLFLLLLFDSIGAQWNTNDFMKREHSLLRPYQVGTGMSIPNWDILGSTIVTPDYVRLTPEEQGRRGALWNTVPVFVNNWEVQVQFKVHSNENKKKDLFGDGLAIWYVKEHSQLGDVFGSKDFFTGLAVMLDTYSNHNGPHNHKHPYVSAMINNGTLHYDHDRDGTHTQLAGCEAQFRNVNHDTHIAVKYENDVLSVLTDVENKAGWKPCFEVQGVKLPTGYYVGVTAATGDLVDIHDVIAVRFYDLDLPDDPKSLEDRSKISPSATFFESPRDHVDDPKPSSLSGIKVFLLMLIGSIAIVACVVMGIMFYQKQQERSRKRFY